MHGPPGAIELIEPRQRLAQYHPIEKQERGERLVLGRSGDIAFAREIVEKCRDFLRA